MLHAEDVSLERLAAARSARRPTSTRGDAPAALRRVLPRRSPAAPHAHLLLGEGLAATSRCSGALRAAGARASTSSPGGELARVLEAGGRPATHRLRRAWARRETRWPRRSRAGILHVQRRERRGARALDAVGRRLRRAAPFAMRVNPDVDARTHRYIATGLKTSKFGVPFDEARALYRRSRADARRRRPAASTATSAAQLTDARPAARGGDGRWRGSTARSRPRGTASRCLDVGGGLGIRYQERESRRRPRPGRAPCCEADCAGWAPPGAGARPGPGGQRRRCCSRACSTGSGRPGSRSSSSTPA